MRAIPSSLKTLLGRGVLALALLFAQQHAALHWLSHAIEATHAKAGKPSPDEHCDDCLAMAGFAAAATGSTPTLPASSAQHTLTAPPLVAAARVAMRLAFRSRAPPNLS
jgi:hypothetical protein